MMADPYARLDAVYLLGALDADERLGYETHLAICRRCGRAWPRSP
jgi:Putative zinc-finger